jgi:hypothetical protein
MFDQLLIDVFEVSRDKQRTIGSAQIGIDKARPGAFTLADVSDGATLRETRDFAFGTHFIHPSTTSDC